MDHFFIVKNGHNLDGDAELFFGPLTPEETVETIPVTSNLLDVLVAVGIFLSKGQARKNWKHGVEIQPGYSSWERLGSRRASVFIFNPTSGNLDLFDCVEGCVHLYV